MRSALTERNLVALSIAYGITVALLAVFARSAVRPVAIIGALVIGGLWVLRGVLSDRT